MTKGVGLSKRGWQEQLEKTGGDVMLHSPTSSACTGIASRRVRYAGLWRFNEEQVLDFDDTFTSLMRAASKGLGYRNSGTF